MVISVVAVFKRRSDSLLNPLFGMNRLKGKAYYFSKALPIPCFEGVQIGLNPSPTI
jgi:hypothetical protein